ncbi:MAG: PEP/pyruvate-binding domain-containing protein, partial [Actinomycetota bacterium]
MDVCWLGEKGCDRPELVGGKAANLSRLAGGFPVPVGFCLAGWPIEPAALTPDLVRLLVSAYRRLGERCGVADLPVAARSSATDEDGVIASFAGQHETFLNVVGADALLAAVSACAASFGSERARIYRRRHGLPEEPARCSILVQQLVAADVSAVVFSVNPVTGSPEEIVINASWGLGETVVGGSVTPDAYLVARSDLTLARRTIGDKRRMTVAIPGGTEEVAVPRRLRARSCLDDDQVLDAARLSLDLEERMGWPVDVECAWASG